MLIGNINQDNYLQYLNMLEKFSGKRLDAPALDDFAAELERRGQEYDPQNSPYCIEGMMLTGRTDNWRKTIDVDPDVQQSIVDMARQHFIEGFGMNGSNDLGEAVRAYLPSVNVEDRLSASWTLQQTYLQEANRLIEVVREHNPGWQPGDWFDKSIFDDYLATNHIDTMA